MQSQRDRIERLADQLAEIATFSGVIKEVADKTRMLALNARIEAARAGTHGAAFRIVADEIGKLAADSDAQTRRIATVVATTRSDLDPLREAIDAGREQGDGLAEALEARETLRRIGELAERLTAPAEHVAAAAESQLQALAEISGHMEGTVAGVAEVDDHAMTMSTEAFALSSSAEEVYELIRPFQTNAFVDRADRHHPRSGPRHRRHPRPRRRVRPRLAPGDPRPALRGDRRHAHRVARTPLRRLACPADRLRPAQVRNRLRRARRRGAHRALRPPAGRAPVADLRAGLRPQRLLAGAQQPLLRRLDRRPHGRSGSATASSGCGSTAPPLVRAARFGLGSSPLPAGRAITSTELQHGRL